ncbi:hypothetical protein DNK06_21775 [Pseudomonas daroniae]|uniref:Uncharacterized protein n=1 Tax=Phytopseudomonas daroniae TaxID=2487519 RepID=A0A4Q9QGB9_9GAMM|nr:hypothetical protein DNK06_21775 [Pseudomonas daroniae]TBU77520.1 hypothetical protein DNK31_21745 [Pseudomonas sp. FRB 228]TBU87604.1 hypothetical protein DNJ99_21625 [Pseudomonas daroniae]
MRFIRMMSWEYQGIGTKEWAGKTAPFFVCRKVPGCWRPGSAHKKWSGAIFNVACDGPKGAARDGRP